VSIGKSGRECWGMVLRLRWRNGKYALPFLAGVDFVIFFPSMGCKIIAVSLKRKMRPERTNFVSSCDDQRRLRTRKNHADLQMRVSAFRE
jgi:hypothetical protein